MNAGIIASKLPPNWQLVAKTTSNLAAWGFDRWRLYTPAWYTKVKMVMPDGSKLDPQPFSGGGFEHEFVFDLSGNVNNEECSLYICGVPLSADFTQLYAYPSGYSATRGINAQLTYWNYQVCNPNAYLRLENQNIADAGFPINAATPIEATTIYLQNNQFTGYWLGLILKRIDEAGKSNVELNYSGNPGDGNISYTYRVNYDNIIARGGSITGTPPPTS